MLKTIDAPTDEQTIDIKNEVEYVPVTILDDPNFQQDLYLSYIDVFGHNGKGNWGEYKKCSNNDCSYNGHKFSIEEIYGLDRYIDIREIHAQSLPQQISHCPCCHSNLVDYHPFDKVIPKFTDKDNSQLHISRDLTTGDIVGFQLSSTSSPDHIWEKELAPLLPNEEKSDIEKAYFFDRLNKYFPGFDTVVYVDELGIKQKRRIHVLTLKMCRASNNYSYDSLSPQERQRTLVMCWTSPNSTMFRVMFGFSTSKIVYSVPESEQNLVIIATELEEFHRILNSSSSDFARAMTTNYANHIKEGEFNILHNNDGH